MLLNLLTVKSNYKNKKIISGEAFTNYYDFFFGGNTDGQLL